MADTEDYEQIKQSMEPCPNCSRKFLPDRLEVHLRSCRPKSNGPPRAKGGGPPQMLACYLCGQQFGSSSLSIHVPQCYKKTLEIWEKGDPATRGQKPKDPSSVDITKEGKSTEQFNNQQYEEMKANMSQCPNCSRRFLPDRLEVHLRSCKGANGNGPKALGGSRKPAPPSGEKPSERGPGQKPQLLACYLCGQQFGSSSLTIHVPQCYKKKLEQWEQGDPSSRGKKPKDPSTVDLTTEGVTREEFNNQQFEDFKANMEQCPNCSRRFLPDRLEVHLRSCKGKPGQAPPPRSKPAGKSAGPPQMMACYLCGQQFGSSSLSIHVPQCYKKMHEIWEKGDPATRGKEPKDPSTVDLEKEGKSTEQFNNQQYEEMKANMSQCPNCSRRFLPDRLEVHLRSCKGANGGGRAMMQTIPGNPSAFSSSKKTTTDGSKEEEGAKKESSEKDESTAVAPVSSSVNPLTNRVPASSLANKSGDEEVSTATTAKSVQPLEGRTCADCSTVEYNEKAKFCSECGSKLESGSSSTSPKKEEEQEKTAETTTASERTKESSNTHVDTEEEKADTIAATKTSRTVTCPNCSKSCTLAEEGGDDDLCPECGCALAAKDHLVAMVCNDCGEVFSQGSKFCEECGEELSEMFHGASGVYDRPTIENVAEPEPDEEEEEEKTDETAEVPTLTTTGPSTPQKPHAPQQKEATTPAKTKTSEAPPAKTLSAKDCATPDRPSNSASAASSAAKSPRTPYTGDIDYNEELPPEGCEVELVQCRHCGRKFNPGGIDRHEEICQRTMSNKRSPMKSPGHRGKR